MTTKMSYKQQRQQYQRKKNKTIVWILGASGDLAKTKLYPALFQLYYYNYCNNNHNNNYSYVNTTSDEEATTEQLPPPSDFIIYGFARTVYKNRNTNSNTSSGYHQQQQQQQHELFRNQLRPYLQKKFEVLQQHEKMKKKNHSTSVQQQQQQSTTANNINCRIYQRRNMMLDMFLESCCYYKNGKNYTDWQSLYEMMIDSITRVTSCSSETNHNNDEYTKHNSTSITTTIVIYLALPSTLYKDIGTALEYALSEIMEHYNNNNKNNKNNVFITFNNIKIVVEKPFGYDTDSCIELLKTFQHVSSVPQKSLSLSNGSMAQKEEEEEQHQQQQSSSNTDSKQRWTIRSSYSSSSTSTTTVYYIDHYLGKEMVQYLPHFCKWWNNCSLNCHQYQRQQQQHYSLRDDRYSPLCQQTIIPSSLSSTLLLPTIPSTTTFTNTIHHVHIVWKEPLHVQDRKGYFDQYGIIRDVVQNHLFQLVTILATSDLLRTTSTTNHNNTTTTTKDVDTINKNNNNNNNNCNNTSHHTTDNSNNDKLCDAKVHVLNHIKPISINDCLLGQYNGYNNHTNDHIDRNSSASNSRMSTSSRTPTYVCLKVQIHDTDSPWNNIPFIIEAGKGLNEHLCEVRVVYNTNANNGNSNENNNTGNDYDDDIDEGKTTTTTINNKSNTKYNYNNNSSCRTNTNQQQHELVFRIQPNPSIYWTTTTITTTTTAAAEAANRTTTAADNAVAAGGTDTATKTNTKLTTRISTSIPPPRSKVLWLYRPNHHRTVDDAYSKLLCSIIYDNNNNNSNNENCSCITGIKNNHNSLFVRDDELIGSWKILTPLLHEIDNQQPKLNQMDTQQRRQQHQQHNNLVVLYPYEYGSTGPRERNSFVQRMLETVQPHRQQKNHSSSSTTTLLFPRVQSNL